MSTTVNNDNTFQANKELQWFAHSLNVNYTIKRMSRRVGQSLIGYGFKENELRKLNLTPWDY